MRVSLVNSWTVIVCTHAHSYSHARWPTSYLPGVQWTSVMRDCIASPFVSIFLKALRVPAIDSWTLSRNRACFVCSYRGMVEYCGPAFLVECVVLGCPSGSRPSVPVRDSVVSQRWLYTCTACGKSGIFVMILTCV